MLGNSNKDISRRLPNRATTPFARIHVDIVGPIQPVGSNGERYWIAFTDDCTRYRWVYTADSKAKFTSILLRFHEYVKTQFGVTVSVYHVDNDTVLINKETTTKLSAQGTVFEPSTTYTLH